MKNVLIDFGPRAFLRLVAVCALHAGAQAQIGPSGPIGPAGSVGSSATTGQGERAAGARVQAPQPARDGQGNRLEVTGNTATGAGCGQAGTSVNSIDVNAQRLEGRTVIVQGRNSSDVHFQPCPSTSSGTDNVNKPARPHDTQVNSIRVR